MHIDGSQGQQESSVPQDRGQQGFHAQREKSCELQASRSTSQDKPRCRRCLLAEIDPEAYHRDIERILVSMRPDEKAADDIYARRLDICRGCDKLLSGTCVACGCYVELRAAMRGGRCPERHWDS